jgi:hypothetical protein
MLALSSLSRNSRYIALLWIGVWILSSTVSLVLTTVEQERRISEAGVPPQFWVSEEHLQNEIEAAKSDWRPLVSYSANLRRVGERLLRTNAAWERLLELAPAGQRSQFLWQLNGNQYPWYWSAGVLAVLFVLSVGILNFSIKSLDRLK